MRDGHSGYACRCHAATGNADTQAAKQAARCLLATAAQKVGLTSRTLLQQTQGPHGAATTGNVTEAGDRGGPNAVGQRQRPHSGVSASESEFSPVLSQSQLFLKPKVVIVAKNKGAQA
jgi:hypothetical protein